MLINQTTDGILTRLIKKSKILTQIPDKQISLQLANFNKEAFTPHIFEAHGNIKFMHCSDPSKSHQQYRKLFLIPSKDEIKLQ